MTPETVNMRYSVFLRLIDNVSVANFNNEIKPEFYKELLTAAANLAVKLVDILEKE